MKLSIKYVLVMFVTLSSFIVHANGKKTKKSKMDLEQVWTFNYEELSKLPLQDKEAFIKSLVKEAQSNIVLKKIKETAAEDTFKSVLDSELKWSSVETKIKNFCQDSHNYNDCEKIANIRVDLVIKNSSHK